MIYPVVRELAADHFPVAVTCRVLRVSTSGYYAWLDRPPSPRSRANVELVEIIREVHDRSRQTYGSPRVHAELRLGHGMAVGRNRVARLMAAHGLVGVHRRRYRHGCTRQDPAATPFPDLVQREFRAERPDALWVSDITEHPTGQGRLYCAVVLDAYSRRVVGWSIAEHLRTELVTDALEMACLRRNTRPHPPTSHHSPDRPDTATTNTVFHSDHGAQYTSWAFGKRLRSAGLLGSMGTVGDCYDNALAESFFATLQNELLDRRAWATRPELANAIFEWIEAWYNPARRHSALDYHSPIHYEQTHNPAAPAA
jgi:putative transposase